MKARRYRVFVILQWIVIILISGTSVCLSQEQKKSLGELKIEGSHVEKLVLRRKNGPNEIIDEPNGIIKIPVGEYSLFESHLKGGYIRLGTSINEWIEVSEDKQAVLKVGAPLVQELELRRQGEGIEFNYKLLGLGGESYVSNQRDKPPSLTVYKGDKVIVSDNFRFG